ncbi:MAG: histidine ammonia-lyase [Phycisphaerales bacterium]|jgi:histidine ammonia-lyase
MPLTLSNEPLQAADVVRVARGQTGFEIAPEALRTVRETRGLLEAQIGSGDTYYGVNTGFGSLSSKRIEGEGLRQLQTNLIRSHAAGVGDPLPVEVVRAMLVLLTASLTRGHSGVRVEVVGLLAQLLQSGVTPVVPELGSVGASGDLAPLAHAALVLLGEGEADYKGQRMPGGEALKRAGLTPIVLEAKEGLALINGTHLMAARFALLMDDLDRLFSAATLAAAMSIDACRATDSFLDPRVYTARNQPGPTSIAAKIRAALAGSQIIHDHRANDPRVQDPYSFRCAAMVLGSCADTIDFARARLADEMNAVTDNPLIFAAASGDGADIISAGNFHGMPLAIPMDSLAITISHLAGISERRVYHMLSVFDPQTNLNPYLSPQPGLHSGLMIAQYTAAALCNELVGLAMPASVANISTSAGMEDYNSFGPRSAAKAARGVELARRVVAIELLCACQAIDVHRPLKTGDALEAMHAKIRAKVPKLTEDRPPSPDIETIAQMIADGELDL